MTGDVTHTISSDYLLRGLDEQRKSECLTDVTVQIDGHEFKVHKTVLSAASEYFRGMFKGGFKEQDANVVLLDDTPVSAECLEVILDGIYCAKLHLTTGNILSVITSVDFLQMHQFQPKCEQFLVENMSRESWSAYYTAAKRYSMNDAVEAARSVVTRNFTSLYKTSEFQNLSHESLLDI